MEDLRSWRGSPLQRSAHNSVPEVLSSPRGTTALKPLVARTAGLMFEHLLIARLKINKIGAAL
jgi:hypothetical protein